VQKKFLLAENGIAISITIISIIHWNCKTRLLL